MKKSHGEGRSDRSRPKAIFVFLLLLIGAAIGIAIWMRGDATGLPGPVPSPEAVLERISGSNPLETAARQRAALQIIKDAIDNWSYWRTKKLDIRDRPANVAALIGQYNLAIGNLDAAEERRALRACGGTKCATEDFRLATRQLGGNVDYQRHILTRTFGETVADAYLAELSTGKRAWGSGVKAAYKTAGEALKARLPSSWIRNSKTIGQIFFFAILPLVTICALLLFLKYKAEEAIARRDSTPQALSGNYGSATLSPPSQRLDGHPYLSGVFLGKGCSAQMNADLRQPYAPVYTRPESHTLIVARARTGKGTRVIIPTLLRFEGAVFTIDPKGENTAVTARIRRDVLGQTVHILNPWGELKEHYATLGLGAAATFNPLDVLDRNDDNCVAIAGDLAAMICPAEPGAKEPYWQQSAATILTAILLWLTDWPEEIKTLARARELVSLNRKDFESQVLDPLSSSEAFHGAIRQLISPFIGLSEVTLRGIVSHLNEATKFLSDPQVRRATNESSFSMDDLVFRKATVYLVIPPERMETQKTWLRLMLTAAMQTFKKHRNSPDRGRCLFLIDEFPALGCIEEMPKHLAAMSGFGLDFTLVIQDMNQLHTLYGKAAGSIISNSGYKWFCNIRDLETAKYLSEALGDETVRTTGETHTSGSNPQGGNSSGQSTTFGEAGSRLMRPEDIMALSSDYAIVFQPHGWPSVLLTVDYPDLQTAFEHLRETHPKMYWPLRFDANPYHARRS